MKCKDVEELRRLREENSNYHKVIKRLEILAINMADGYDSECKINTGEDAGAARQALKIIYELQKEYGLV